MRSLILERLYEWSLVPYRKYFKTNTPWNITAQTLLTYPESSLGFHLGCFLITYDFSSQPQLEDHDVFHVLTGSGVSVPEEVAMQYYLIGNGKHSMYGVAVIVLGSLLFPDELRRFVSAYKKGRTAHPFHQLDFLLLLQQPLKHLKTTFNIQNV